MTEWIHKINIKPYISDRTDRAAIVAACKGVLRELDRIAVAFKEGGALGDIMREFQAVLDDEEAGIDEFNDVLEWLYDWADANRVWLGLK